MRFLIFILAPILLTACIPETERVSVKNFTLDVPVGLSYDKQQSGNKLISFSNGSKLKLFIEDGIGGVVRPGRVAERYGEAGVEDVAFNHLFDGYYRMYKGKQRLSAETRTVNGNKLRLRRFLAEVNDDMKIYFEVGLLMVDSRYYTIINSGLQDEEGDYKETVNQLIGSIRAK